MNLDKQLETFFAHNKGLLNSAIQVQANLNGIYKVENDEFDEIRNQTFAIIWEFLHYFNSESFRFEKQKFPYITDSFLKSCEKYRQNSNEKNLDAWHKAIKKITKNAAERHFHAKKNLVSYEDTTDTTNDPQEVFDENEFLLKKQIFEQKINKAINEIPDYLTKFICKVYWNHKLSGKRGYVKNIIQRFEDVEEFTPDQIRQIVSRTNKELIAQIKKDLKAIWALIFSKLFLKPKETAATILKAITQFLSIPVIKVPLIILSIIAILNFILSPIFITDSGEIRIPLLTHASVPETGQSDSEQTAISTYSSNSKDTPKNLISLLFYRLFENLKAMSNKQPRKGVFPITTHRNSFNSQVAWNGENFIVFWLETHAQRLCSHCNFIFSTQLTPDGKTDEPHLLIPDSLLISDNHRSDNEAKESRRNLKVVWNGQNFLLIWETGPCGSDIPMRDNYKCRISGAIVSHDGRTVIRDEFPIISTIGHFILPLRRPLNPQVTWNGQYYFVVWTDGRSVKYHMENEDSKYKFLDIYGARISEDGTVLDPDGIAISTFKSYQNDLTMAWNGDYFLILWQDQKSGFYGTRISPNEKIEKSNEFLIPISDWEPNVPNPQLAWENDHFLLIWRDRKQLNGLFLNAQGKKMRKEFIISPLNDNSSHNVSWGGNNFLVAWQDTRTASDSDFDGDGVSNLEDNCLYMKNPDQINSDGDDLGDVCDPSNATQDSFERRIIEGQPSLPHSIFSKVIKSPANLLDTGSMMLYKTAYHYQWPTLESMAWNGNYFLVTLSDDSRPGFYGRFITP